MTKLILRKHTEKETTKISGNLVDDTTVELDGETVDILEELGRYVGYNVEITISRKNEEFIED